jgi:hypothetical protein
MFSHTCNNLCVLKFLFYLMCSMSVHYIIQKTLIINKCTKSFFINCNTLLHVSTLLDHLQGELFVIVTLRLHFTVEWECAVDCVLRCFWRRELSAVPACRPGPQSSRLQYTVNSTFSLNCKVQPYCNDNKKILPEDDPAGLKHVGVCYNWWKNLCAFVGD